MLFAGTMENESSEKTIDRSVFGITIFTVVFICLLLVLAPEPSQASIDHLFFWITNRLGILFLWAGVGTLLFLLALVLSPWRSIKLGPIDSQPEHSTLSWAGMLFSTGIGTAILYWGTIEWIEYDKGPPFGLSPRSAEALPWATSYGMFHWGPIGWAFYALPAVCLSHAYHVRGEPSLSLASACSPLLRGQTARWPGRTINLLFMIGLLGSASTGLGLTTPLITESLAAFFRFEPTFVHTALAVLMMVGLIAASVSLGLEQGIKRLSNLNLGLVFLLLAVILFAGPTRYILSKGVDQVLFMVGHFHEMTALRNPPSHQAFARSWTVFYWAWWLALGPFVGMFICKISRGRTMGQLILGVLGFGSLGCTLCFIVLGNYSLYLEQETSREIIEIFENRKYEAIVSIMTSLPPGRAILPLFFFLCLSFAATTYDSASYTLAAAATRKLPPDQNPARWHRAVWALILGVLPLTLLSIGHFGSQDSDAFLRPLQTASIVASLPLLPIGLAMAISLLMSLHKEP